jgi:hypothetical protein
MAEQSASRKHAKARRDKPRLASRFLTNLLGDDLLCGAEQFCGLKLGLAKIQSRNDREAVDGCHAERRGVRRNRLPQINLRNK